MPVVHIVRTDTVVGNRTAHVSFVRMENREARFAKNWERMFGVRIKDLRQAQDWTQGDLAARMTSAGYPMHQTTVAKIESGSRPTNVGELAALAAIFGVPIGDIFATVERGDARIIARMATLFDRWETARARAVRAKEEADRAFNRMAEFVQENHSEALAPFWDRARLWAEDVGEGATEADIDATHKTLMARAVPVEPFQEAEADALRILAAEREAGDGEH